MSSAQSFLTVVGIIAWNCYETTVWAFVMHLKKDVFVIVIIIIVVLIKINLAVKTTIVAIDATKIRFFIIIGITIIAIILRVIIYFQYY